ncbi:MAG: hypothetical protein PHF98_04880 [Patescibacteria group bacterium]|nr:hypothetical protein [Patescibacteria group bacterium]
MPIADQDIENLKELYRRKHCTHLTNSEAADILTRLIHLLDLIEHYESDRNLRPQVHRIRRQADIVY